MRRLVPFDNANSWNYARCIMLAASFDSTFAMLYPNGIGHREAHTEVVLYIDSVLKGIQGDESLSGATRKNAKRLRGILESDSFSAKLHQFEFDHEALINSFQTGHYSQTKQYNSFAERMQTLRNQLAHGTIDANVSEQVLVDALLLERIALWCQLFVLGLGESEVARIVSSATRSYPDGTTGKPCQK